MIQVAHLNRQFHQREILKDVCCDFYHGQLYVIKGVSGSGKSTLLNIIGGMDKGYQGTCLIDGKPLSDPHVAEKHRANVGYIYQESLLFAHLSILDNLLFFSSDRDLINHLASELSIQRLLMKKPSELSNGERQRVAIARGLLNHHQVILADEPTASLDRENAEVIAKLFKKVAQQGYLVIVATHDDVFDQVADEIEYLDYGVLRSQQRSNHTESPRIESKQRHSAHRWRMDFRYARAHLKHLGLGMTVTLSVLFAIVMGALSIRLHVRKEYERYIMNHYPLHVFEIWTEKTSREPLYPYEIIPDYHFVSASGLRVNGLMSAQDSSLNVPDALLVGVFPEKQDEVIVNYSYLVEGGWGEDPKQII